MSSPEEEKLKSSRPSSHQYPLSVLALPKPTLLLLLALLTDRRALRPPSLLRPRLLPLLDVPPTRTATALAQCDQPSQDRARGGDPHESEHLGADAALDVELLDGGDGVLHDYEEDGGDDCGDGGEEGGQEGQDGDEERQPARVDCEEDHGDHEEGEAGAGEEEAEHPVGDDFDEVQDVGYVGGEGDWDGVLVVVHGVGVRKVLDLLLAPASSWLWMMSTGLNHHNVVGLEQN
jgi:hypothetical protein